MKLQLYMANTMIQLTPMVRVDIREMMGLHNDSEDAYFKVDEIATHHGKRIRDFFREDISKARVEYTKARIVARKELERGNSLELLSDLVSGFGELEFSKDKHDYYVDNIRYNRYDLDYIAYRLDGRGKQMDATVKGTYIHSDLAMEFMRWLSPKLAVDLDIAFKSVVKQLMVLKEDRRATIREFHKLTPIIDKYYTPKQPEGYPQQYACERIFDMINIEVLGCKASVFKKKHNIAQTEATRDWATPKQLEDISKAEDLLCGLIKFTKINDYQELKEQLHYMMIND